MPAVESKLIVSLLDRLTGPARGVTAQIDRLTAASQANAARLSALRGQMLGAVGAGYALYKGLSAPLTAAIGFESKLEDIGQKINEPVKFLPKLGQEIRKVARDTTQSASAMAEGMDILAGMGAGRDDALALLNPIGKAATAYKAEIGDLAQAGYAALDNLKVPANDFGKALDAMAVAGKAGSFELRDMSRYFPTLGAGYQALKQTGVPAVADLSAALQIVRKGTGDSASAATNLSNILQKINAPLTRKNFAKMGVDLEKEMAKAAKKGMTPIEAIAEITNRTLKGDLGRLGDLFNDAQVQQGLRPLIQNIEEYRRIRAEAMAAQGVVEEDYQRRLLTGEVAAKRFSIAIENINNAVGAALLPALADMAGTLVPIVNRMAEWAEANPGLTRGLVTATSALIGFRVASIGVRFAGLFMKQSFLDAGIAALTAARGIGRIAFAPAIAGFRALRTAMVGYTAAAAIGGHGTALSVMGQSMLGLLNPIRLVTTAFRILKFAVVGTGIGAVLAGVALAGAWIYNNWTGISTAFEAFKGAFMRAVEPVMPVLRPVLDGIQWLSDTISSIVGPIDEMGGSWARLGLEVGKFVGETVKAIVELPGRIVGFAGDMLKSGIALMQSLWDGITTKAGSIVDWFSELPTRLTGAMGNMLEAGMALAQSMWDGVKVKIDEMLAWFKGLPRRIVSAIGSIDIGSLIKWPSMPSWLGGGTPSGNANPDAGRAAGAMLDGMEQRASGGPVQAGRTYLVGERGPELFSPGRSGFISPNEVYAQAANGPRLRPKETRMSAPSATVHLGGVHIHGITDPVAIADQVAEIMGRKLNDVMTGIQCDIGYMPNMS